MRWAGSVANNFIVMSRYGLAMTLAWYRLSPKVSETFHDYAIIKIAKIATIEYGHSRIEWIIRLPRCTLEYKVVCTWVDRCGPYYFGSRGNCSWTRGMGKYAGDSNGSECKHMPLRDFEIWSRRMLGWKVYNHI